MRMKRMRRMRREGGSEDEDEDEEEDEEGGRVVTEAEITRWQFCNSPYSAGCPSTLDLTNSRTILYCTTAKAILQLTTQCCHSSTLDLL